jgi:hypothetical protein
MKKIMAIRNRIKKNRRKISSKIMKKNSRNNKISSRTNSNNLKASHKLNLNNHKEAIINYYPNNSAHSIKKKTHNLKVELLN